MAIKKHPHTGPLLQGHELQVAKETFTTATENEYQFTIQADTVLISLQASVVSGDLDVVVYTEGDSEDTVGNRVPIITFPTLSSPTSELLLKKAASAMQKVRVVVTSTGGATFTIRAKGLSVGEATVTIAGSTSADNYGIRIDSTPRLVIPVALTDQNGISIINTSTSGTLYVGFKSSITPGNTAAVGVRDSDAATPVPAGSAIGLDITAGVTLYGVSDGPDLDIRILQLGG